MRIARKLVGVLALLAGLGQPACGGRDESTAVSPSPVAGLLETEWSLVELDGRPAGAGTAGVAPTLVLAAEGLRASGFAGCNRFIATYMLAGDRLRFGLLAMTRMFCAETMDLEQRYVSALEATRGYRLAPSRLELVGEPGVVARFEMK